jgi:hypothetical protein
VSGQTVEYTFSHIFDKALESCFGYIGVLPGAFSAYRWEAIKGGPLEDDYYTTMTRPEIMNAYYSNIFLAEDRVLSLAIVSKPGTTNLLKFVHLAYAETDVPDKIFVLLSQRRRWINGSWFALIETWRNFGNIKRSNHSRWRKIWFTIEIVYFTATIFVSWVMVGSFYLFTELIFGGLLEKYPASFLRYFSGIEIVMNLYLGLLMLMFMLSLGVKTAKIEITYKVIGFFFACYMMFGFMILNYFTFSEANKLSLFSIFLLAGSMGSYSIGVLITKNTKKVLFRTVQFLIITPVYVNMFGIYAVCNIHDCSWGNRPEVMTEEELMKVADFQHYRTKWVIIWIISNVLYYKIMSASMMDPNQTALTILFTLAVILILIRFFGCIWHYFTWWLDNRTSGSKRYIALSSAAVIENQNNKILSEINDKLNKSMRVGGSKALRNSILDIMEKKGKDKLGKSFHMNLTRMIKKSELMDSEESESQEISSESHSQEKILKKSKTTKKFKKDKKSELKKGYTVILRDSALKEESKDSEEMEKNSEKARPITKHDEAKKFLDGHDMSDIKGEQSGVFDFESSEIIHSIVNKNESSIKGVFDMDKSEQNDFIWEDSEEVKNVVDQIRDKSEEPSESSGNIETDNTEDAERYLEMLDSIIKSISLDSNLE